MSINVKEEFENYPYKRVYATATTFDYPLEFIEELISKFEYESDDNKENFVKMVIFRIGADYDYSFTNKNEFHELLENVYHDGLYKKNSYYSYAVKNVLVN